MGNEINKGNPLKEVADNMRNPSDENDSDETSHEEQEKKAPKIMKKDIDFDNLSFSEMVHYGLEDIDSRDQLQVSGYFRHTAINEYNMEIPHGIINYCVMYLFYEDERQLFIGNLHREITGGAISTRRSNNHHWTMFISTSKKELKAPKSIKEVTYYLHPTFNPSECTKKKSPFELGRRGWGTFTVEAKIVFHDKHKRKDCWAQHALSFDHHATITQIELTQQIRIKDEVRPWHARGRQTLEVLHFAKPDDYPRNKNNKFLI